MFIVIVATDSNTLAPANNPRIYKTFAQARAVAYSMAEKHGQPFFVWEARFAAVPSKVRGVFLDDGDMIPDAEDHHGAV